jgi:uncharacterized integral membrane protein
LESRAERRVQCLSEPFGERFQRLSEPSGERFQCLSERPRERFQRPGRRHDRYSAQPSRRKPPGVIMIRSLHWLFRAALFVIVLGFALANSEVVEVRFLGLDTVWRAPLVVFLAGFFAAGMVVGLLALTPKFYAQRREIERLSRKPQASAAGAHGV